MRQEEINIYNCKKGDLITRIRPSKPYPGSEELGEALRDRAYIGKALIFLGIANGCIYVDRPPKTNEDEDSPLNFLSSLFEKAGPINLPTDMWDEGWSYYVDPYKIEEQEIKKAATKLLNGANRIVLEKELKKALSEENYELADEIKKQLQKYLKK